MITVSGSLNDSEYGKILLSNVMVTRKKYIFMGRTWRTLDIQTSLGVLVVHLLALFAPFTFTWGAFWASFASYVLRGTFGITLSYHRNLAHHSVKLPKWLEYTFAYLGVLAFQISPSYVDSEKDPHSPIFGFWFSHMGWLFDSGYILEKYQEHKNVDDLKKQPFYRFIKRTYTLHLFVFTALVYVFGGFTYLVWVVVRICWNMFQLCVLKRLWVALVSFGEGWHNNHHAFEYSARHGLEWWQIDVGWYTIRFLEAVGLATNVKLPTEAHKLKKSVASLNKFK
ncbi:putative acyl-CoA desaturase [Helianthus annuus]|nr:putative acyl-CoA desaturase [Helianthus annuus]